MNTVSVSEVPLIQVINSVMDHGKVLSRIVLSSTRSYKCATKSNIQYNNILVILIFLLIYEICEYYFSQPTYLLKNLRSFGLLSYAR